MKPTVTISDVARQAGVSEKTVSRVVNGESYVSEAKQVAVRAAISALGYRPNVAARSLAASRSFTLGLIANRMDAYNFRALHTSGVRLCSERGLHLIVEELPTLGPAEMQRLEKSLRQVRYEGVIVTQVADTQRVLDVLERTGTRYVRMSPLLDPERSDSVSVEVAEGYNLVAEHLYALGHRRIALPVLTPRVRQRNIINEALRQMRTRLLDLGCAERDIVEVPLLWKASNMEAGLTMARAVLEMRPRPTAVFAMQDEVAASLVNYAWSEGVNVPRDLSVVGFEDDDIARVVWPPLTTVRQPFDEMTAAAVELLVNPAADGAPRSVTLPSTLVVRQSTGEVPDAA